MNACQDIWSWTTSIHITCYSNMHPNLIHFVDGATAFLDVLLQTFCVHILSPSSQLTYRDHLVFTIHITESVLYKWRSSSLCNIPIISRSGESLLWQMFHILAPHFLNFKFNVILLSTPRFSKCTHPWGFSINICVPFSLPTCLLHVKPIRSSLIVLP